MSKNLQDDVVNTDSKVSEKSAVPTTIYKTSKITLLLSLIACIGVIGLGYEGVYGRYGILQQQKKELSQQQRIDSLLSNNQQLQAKLESVVTAQNKITASISALTPSQTGIILTQLNGLVNGAVQSLVVYHDVVGSIKLLSSAEQVLLTTNDPLFSGLKIALAKNVASLNAQNNVDLTMTLAKVASISDLAKNLQTSQVLSLDKSPSTPNLWDKFLTNVKEQLSSLIIVRKVHSNGTIDNGNINSQKLAQQQIQLNVLSLRQALITNNVVLWNSSLSDLAKVIDSYYIHDGNAQKILAILGQLKAVNFQAENLNIDDSIQALSKANQMYFGK